MRLPRLRALPLWLAASFFCGACGEVHGNLIIQHDAHRLYIPMAPPPIPALHGEGWPRRALLTVTGAAWQRPRFRSSGTCWTDGRFVGSRSASNVAMLAGASGKAVSVLAAADRLRARPSDACLLVLWPCRASMVSKRFKSIFCGCGLSFAGCFQSFFEK